VSKPRYEPKPFQPYTREEGEALLKACEKSKDVITRNRRRFAMRPPLADRNAALVLVLLDSGLRSGEVCALNLGDYDEQTGELEVKHGRAGGAKGRKGRVVYLGKAARRSLWRRSAWPSAMPIATKAPMPRCSSVTPTAALTAIWCARFGRTWANARA
jgi:integrase/recombinase XerD